MKKIFLLLLFVFSNIISFAQISEGDTMQFWSVSYVDWPPLWGTPQRVVNAICKKAGEHCYVFVEDIATQPSQASIDTLVSHFDNHFYPELTALYGPVPDALDNDSSVFILAFDESNWAGYFDPGQQMPDTFMYSHWSMHSSQREIIYIAADYFSGAESIVAHEFGHLLHWQQDHSPEPVINPVKYWEEAWIDEGFSTFAAEYLIHDVTQQGVMHSDAYFSGSTDLPLIFFSSYDQVMLWSVFMYEHFGGDQYIKMLIKEQENGVEGMRKALDSLGYSESFEDAFEQWIIANYIDDESFESGKYSYSHFDFPAAHSTFSHSTYPTGLKIQTLKAFGADYNIFNTTAPGAFSLTFNGDTASDYRLAFILINTAATSVVDVINVLPDAQNTAVFDASEFGTDYNRIVMAVMCVDTELGEDSTVAYSYSATLTPVSVDEKDKENELVIYPVPATNKLHVVNNNVFQDTCDYEISGPDGRTLLHGKFSGKSVVIDVSGLKQSVYFIKIFSPGKTVCKKFVKK